ncbi:26S proteasome regulatory subunit rpn6 [Tulasnella sp. 424]|nr:26S proteasome regulatory subunit rpn6 [Tulasnella sp. 424]
MSSTAKAKTAKLIRTLIDFFSSIPGSESSQKQVLEDNIAWARQEKRIFLKQSLEARLVALHLETQSYRPALGVIDGLLKELKRLGDKLILTEVHPLESRVYRGIGNFRLGSCWTGKGPGGSQMILDKILSGVLDQGRGCLIIFDPQEEDALYGDAIKTIEQVGKVVDSLYAKTVRIA